MLRSGNLKKNSSILKEIKSILIREHFHKIHDDSIFELDRKQTLKEASMGVATYRKTLLKFCKVYYSFQFVYLSISIIFIFLVSYLIFYYSIEYIFDVVFESIFVVGGSNIVLVERLFSSISIQVVEEVGSYKIIYFPSNKTRHSFSKIDNKKF